MAVATRSRSSSLVVSLLGLALVVLACLVEGAECRRVVYGDVTGRRSLVVVKAGGPVAGGPLYSIPDEDDYESSEDGPVSMASNAPVPVNGVFDVTQYGAKADGETDDALV
ncbi:hypothetical protein MLD38_028145 [Melastoma candidum]|uniref:Uncharacterized protein n=1 Tax=Melastoma candidum TaxID=119954 RepID=A0ACB9N002_9MYRT|nr:hypothetical protein MLD38_028145 [Melastoma candidum]